MANVASLILLAAGAAAHEAPEPAAFGVLSAAWIVAASMFVLLLVALFVKVPAAMAKGLDSSIDEIKNQLEEAKALRADAEKLRAEYATRIANAEKDAASMIEHAKVEAQAIIAKAEADTTEVIARREKMASDKIDAAQRGAVADLRAKTAEAATKAARGLIASQYGAAADLVQVNQAIAGL